MVFTILKQDRDTVYGGGRRRNGSHQRDEFPEVPYNHDLPRQDLMDMTSQCVLIDPGRRDLYCMHEDSTAEQHMVYHYTRNQKAKELRTTRFRRLRERLKPNVVKVAEQHLALHPRSTVNSLAYMRYLIIRAMVNTYMMEH
jgi:hypothetical protein